MRKKLPGALKSRWAKVCLGRKQEHVRRSDLSVCGVRERKTIEGVGERKNGREKLGTGKETH